METAISKQLVAVSSKIPRHIHKQLKNIGYDHNINLTDLLRECVENGFPKVAEKYPQIQKVN